MRADSPDGDEDLLPGLCAFAQRWLSGAAFPRFRDTADPPPAALLTDYYEVRSCTGPCDSSKLWGTASPMGSAALTG